MTPPPKFFDSLLVVGGITLAGCNAGDDTPVDTETGETGNTGETGDTDTGETDPGETDTGDTGETDTGDTGETDTGDTGETDTGDTGDTDTGDTDPFNPGPGDCPEGEILVFDSDGDFVGEYADLQAAFEAANENCATRIDVCPGTYVGGGEFVVEDCDGPISVRGVDGSSDTVVEGGDQLEVYTGGDLSVEGVTFRDGGGIALVAGDGEAVLRLRDIVIEANQAGNGVTAAVALQGSVVETSSLAMFDNVGFGSLLSVLARQGSVLEGTLLESNVGGSNATAAVDVETYDGGSTALSMFVSNNTDFDGLVTLRGLSSALRDAELSMNEGSNTATAAVSLESYLSSAVTSLGMFENANFDQLLAIFGGRTQLEDAELEDNIGSSSATSAVSLAGREGEVSTLGLINGVTLVGNSNFDSLVSVLNARHAAVSDVLAQSNTGSTFAGAAIDIVADEANVTGLGMLTNTGFGSLFAGLSNRSVVRDFQAFNNVGSSTAGAAVDIDGANMDSSSLAMLSDAHLNGNSDFEQILRIRQNLFDVDNVDVNDNVAPVGADTAVSLEALHSDSSTLSLLTNFNALGNVGFRRALSLRAVAAQLEALEVSDNEGSSSAHEAIRLEGLTTQVSNVAYLNELTALGNIGFENVLAVRTGRLEARDLEISDNQGSDDATAAIALEGVEMFASHLSVAGNQGFSSLIAALADHVGIGLASIQGNDGSNLDAAISIDAIGTEVSTVSMLANTHFASAIAALADGGTTLKNNDVEGDLELVGRIVSVEDSDVTDGHVVVAGHSDGPWVVGYVLVDNSDFLRSNLDVVGDETFFYLLDSMFDQGVDHAVHIETPWNFVVNTAIYRTAGAGSSGIQTVGDVQLAGEDVDFGVGPDENADWDISIGSVIDYDVNGLQTFACDDQKCTFE